MCVSKHHIVHLKYIQLLLVNQTSIKVEKKKVPTNIKNKCNSKGFTWQVLERKAALPTSDIGHNWCSVRLEPKMWVHLLGVLHIWIPRSSSQALGQGSIQACLSKSPSWRRRGKAWRCLPPLWLCTHCFSTLSYLPPTAAPFLPLPWPSGP